MNIFSIIKKLNFLSLLFVLCLFLPNCKKFVHIDPPISQLISTNVFEDPTTATAAQTSIYAKMENYSYNLSLDCGLMTDELKNWSTTQANLIEFYTNSLKAIDAPPIWADCYKFIYQANSVIEGLTNNKYLRQNVINQLLGEAKFIRAFWYFYLTNLYGDIPLVLTTDYKTNSFAVKSSQQIVYNQIRQDLNDAKSLLNPNFIDATDTAMSTERVRPNKYAASALLSRVHLYTGNWNSAITEATDIINNSSFSLPKLDSVFLKNNKEAIWQIQIPLPRSYNTSDGKFFILTGNPSAGTTNNATINTPLLNAFEPNDNRKTKWIKSITTSQGTYYFPYKYKVQTGSTISEYTMVLRLAEQYLIRAEAETQINNLTAAVNDLNIIRTRAGLTGYSGTVDKASLLTAILHEMQVEFFCEWGHRWFDLKRTNTLDATMSTVTPQKGGTWNSYQALLPIAQTEIGANPNLTQNPGY